MRLVKNCAVIQILIASFEVIEPKFKQKPGIVIINMVGFGGFCSRGNRAEEILYLAPGFVKKS